VRNKGGGTEEHRGVEVRNKGGGSEEHAHPGKPYFMRVSGLAKNPILSKTVQDCLRTEAAAACLDDSGLASKIEREARNLQTGRTERPSAARSFILYEAEGASMRGWSLRHKGWGEFETQAPPASPYIMRVSGLAKNPILYKPAAEGTQTKGGEIVICSITDSTRRSPC